MQSKRIIMKENVNVQLNVEKIFSLNTINPAHSKGWYFQNYQEYI